MQAIPRQIEKYLTPLGRCPFDDWLLEQRDRKVHAVINARLLRIMQGNFGDCKSVGGSVRELRIDFGPGYRVYFADEGKTLVILLCGGSKTTQAKDIQTAQAYWQEYRS